MKTRKTTLDTQIVTEKQATLTKQPKSLRPMRSMVAVRSFKPKTLVASFPVKEVQEEAPRN